MSAGLTTSAYERSPDIKDKEDLQFETSSFSLVEWAPSLPLPIGNLSQIASVASKDDIDMH